MADRTAEVDGAVLALVLFELDRRDDERTIGAGDPYSSLGIPVPHREFQLDLADGTGEVGNQVDDERDLLVAIASRCRCLP